MTRFITITLAAVATIAAGLAFGSPATARGMHANGPAATVHWGGMHPNAWRGAGPWHGNRFAFQNRFAFRHHFFAHRFAFRHHHFFAHRFAFIGAPLYDDCYTRVWTRWGWRRIWVCD